MASAATDYSNQQGNQQSDVDEQEIVNKARSIWKYVSEARRRAELGWFINQQAHDNNQFLYYNTATRALQPVAATNRRDRVTINRVFQQVRSTVSYINQRKPQVTIIPGEQADGAYVRATKSKYLCDYWYDALQMNKKNKIISKDGCIYGIGAAKILWNKDALAPTVPFTMGEETRTHQYGEVMFERCDPFELYWDPLATCKEDMRYLVHALPRTMGELRNNPAYKNTEKVTPDKKLAASYLKQTQLRQNIAGGSAMTPSMIDDLETVVTLEVFWKQWDASSKKWRVCLCTMTEGGVMLLYEYWDMDEFPFEFYVADITGSMLQSKGVVHNIREPNRAANDLVSQLLESARIMGKLNWIMPRGANPGVITDETGQFIEYDVNPGGGPTQAQPAGIPSYVENLLGYMDSAIMDLGGSHDASVGKTVFKGASGDLVQALQAGDASSLSMLRDNYDDFLIRSFKLMLKTAKHFGSINKTPRLVRTGEKDPLGQYQWEKLSPDEISTEDDIQVRSGSNLPFSSDQRQQFFLNLWKEGVIKDADGLLKLMELPDIANVLGDQQADIERELENIVNATKGKDIPDPVIAENHGAHIATLDKFIRSKKYRELKDDIQQKLLDHRDKHVKMSSELQRTAMLNQYEPVRRTEQVSLQVRDMAGSTPQERDQLFNMTSDSFDIQRRGGLVVQGPADAEAQAQNEDIEMMDGRPMQVSIGDNHPVHIDTHVQVVENPDFANLPPAAQQAFQDHIKAHQKMMAELMPAPGLVPDSAVNNLQPQQPPGPAPQPAPGPKR